MKRIYSTFGFLIAILIFGCVVYLALQDANPIALLKQIGLSRILQNFLVGIAYFFSFGVLMKVAYQHHFNLRLKWSDTFFLPFMMHLWTYILPVKGGLIFQTYFVKTKYGLDMSKGFSIGVLVFIASLLITCFIGGALSFLIDDAFSLQILLLIMFGILILFLLAGQFASRFCQSKSGGIYSVIAFFQNVIVQFTEQLRDEKLLFKVIFITIVSTLFHAIWFYHCAYILDYDPEPIGILLATLVLRIVTLVRVLPGNLGIQEVMIGSIFLTAGLEMKEGLTTALLVRVVSVVLAGTAGTIGLYLNFRYFQTNSIGELLTKLKRSGN